MLVIAPQTIRNPGILETKAIPRKFFGRVTVWPKSASTGMMLRLFIEMQLIRYLAALTPFVALILLVPDSAAPVSQAPLAMVLLIALIEYRVLGLSEGARKRLMSEEDARGVIDTLSFRGQDALRAIAARHPDLQGDLVLVVEQSALARIAPLTFVTVQSATPRPHVLDLDPGDRAVLEGLFDDAMGERDLLKANLRLNQTLHQVRIEAQSVSATARLAAWMDSAQKTPAPA